MAELDAQMKVKREAMTPADTDECAALEIEYQPCAFATDVAQAAVDAFILQRCRTLPDGKAAKENAQPLAKAATQVEREIESYGNIVANCAMWPTLIATGRRVRADKRCELTLPPPTDADRRRGVRTP